jgi:hypothetical protein
VRDIDEEFWTSWSRYGFPCTRSGVVDRAGTEDLEDMKDASEPWASNEKSVSSDSELTSVVSEQEGDGDKSSLFTSRFAGIARGSNESSYVSFDIGCPNFFALDLRAPNHWSTRKGLIFREAAHACREAIVGTRGSDFQMTQSSFRTVGVKSGTRGFGDGDLSF